MQDQISLMRIILFARTGEKLQRAQASWLGQLQSLVQSIMRLLVFVLINILSVLKNTPSILVKSVLPEICIFLSYEKQASVPQSFAYLFSLREMRRDTCCIMHTNNSESHYTHFHLRNFKYSKHAIKMYPTLSATAFSKQGFHDQILSNINKQTTNKKHANFLIWKKKCCGISVHCKK